MQGMELSYVRADAAQTSGKVRVKFDPPLISYDEVRCSHACSMVINDAWVAGAAASHRYEVRRRGGAGR